MNARTTALSALIAVRRQNAWADGALKEYIARDRLSRRDAALAARLVYGVVQNRLLLDFDLAQVVSSPLAKLQPVVLDILRRGRERAAGPRDKIFPPPAARRLPARVHGRRNARGLPCR